MRTLRRRATVEPVANAAAVNDVAEASEPEATERVGARVEVASARAADAAALGKSKLWK